MKQYEANITRSVEQDDYENGCDPETFMDFGVIQTFRSSNLNSLKSKIEDNIGVDLTNADEFEGRLALSQLETNEGFAANDTSIQDWKLGKINLYNVTYTIYLNEIEIRDVNAELLKG